VQVVAHETVELTKTYRRGLGKGRAQGKGEDKREKGITRRKRRNRFPRYLSLFTLQYIK
jgi:hypothetical protein